MEVYTYVEDMASTAAHVTFDIGLRTQGTDATGSTRLLPRIDVARARKEKVRRAQIIGAGAFIRLSDALTAWQLGSDNGQPHDVPQDAQIEHADVGRSRYA